MSLLETLLITSYDHRRRLESLSIKGIGKLVAKRRHDIYGKNQLPRSIRTTLRTEDTGVRVEAVIPHDALLNLTMVVEGSETGWKVNAKNKKLISKFNSTDRCCEETGDDRSAEVSAPRHVRKN